MGIYRRIVISEDTASRLTLFPFLSGLPHHSTMANSINYGHRALVVGSRSCALPDCDCRTDLEMMRASANSLLDASHQLDEATFRAICQDVGLDQHHMSDRPAISAGGKKQRNDGNFERAVEDAFKVSRASQHSYSSTGPTLPVMCQISYLANVLTEPERSPFETRSARSPSIHQREFGRPIDPSRPIVASPSSLVASGGSAQPSSATTWSSSSS